MKILEKIFSVKNEYINNKKYKIITILGLKIKKTVSSKFIQINNEKYKRELTLDEKIFYLKTIFKNTLGYELNLNEPKTFNEKLQWLKLYDHNPLMTICADKYKIREYIEEKIGGDYLIPLIGVWDNPDEIDFDSLPNQFVLKVNWGSGQNIIVKDKTKLNIEEVKEKIKTWLKPESNHYYMGLEWGYKNIPAKIIIEKYIQQGGEPLQDYKFFVFNGVPKILSITIDSYDYSKMCINYYDMDFNLLPYTNSYPQAKYELKKPKHYEKMLEIINKLGNGFNFVRIDFYDTQERLYVGEFTFYPGCGLDKFDPIEWDYKLGEMLILPLKSQDEQEVK